MMAEPFQSQSPSAFHIHTPSPLDSLVRRTSQKRLHEEKRSRQPIQYPYRQQSHYSHNEQPQSSQQSDYYDSLYAPKQFTPPRAGRYDSSSQPPSSPILHGHFARGSVATESSRDNNSYLDMSRDSIDVQETYRQSDRYYDDGLSVYSQSTMNGPALRDSWESGNTARNDLVNRLRQEDDDDPEAAYAIYPTEPPSPQAYTVPTVIVSSDPVEDESYYAGRAPVQGRAPIVRAPVSNFSRPSLYENPATPPARPPDDDHKWAVLQRNSKHSHSPRSQKSTSTLASTASPSSLYSPAEYHSSPPASQARQTPQSPSYQEQEQSRVLTSSSPEPYARSLSPASTIRRSPTPGTDPPSSNLPPIPSSVSAPDMSTLSMKSPALPRKPPSLRAASPASSIYSAYSYYQLEGSSPSPTGTARFPESKSAPNNMTRGMPPRNSPTHLSPSHTPLARSPSPASTAEEFLQLGIQHHEANRLHESAACFEKSAKEGGGCGVGMLMWGLTLRHGWGCKKDEKAGFKWVQKAAESAVDNLESARRASGVGLDPSVVKSELVLAIYEVGQCFFHGWGVAKDQKMGVSYYAVAARLGDADAQTDLAFCLANGKGCKKDRKEAAKWYRAAVAQGQSDVGLAWIYKEKFQ